MAAAAGIACRVFRRFAGGYSTSDFGDAGGAQGCAGLPVVAPKLLSMPCVLRRPRALLPDNLVVLFPNISMASSDY